MMDCLFIENLSETCRKPAGNQFSKVSGRFPEVSGRFPAGFRQVSGGFRKSIIDGPHGKWFLSRVEFKTHQ